MLDAKVQERRLDATRLAEVMTNHLSSGHQARLLPRIVQLLLTGTDTFNVEAARQFLDQATAVPAAASVSSVHKRNAFHHLRQTHS